MKTGSSLQRRIARTFVLLAVLLASLFSVVAYVAVEVIEAQVIETRLERVADRLIAHHVAKEAVDLPPDISFFANMQIPPALQLASPGIHEADLGGHEVQALIRTVGADRFAVVLDMDQFEHTEHVVFSALGAGFVASVLLAIVLGTATARQLVAPVSALAAAVGRDARPDELPSLGADDEIGVLARALAKRTESLQQALLRERLFTADVSHELRTPLTIMLGGAEVLTVQLSDRPAQHAVAERVRRVAAETADRVSALLLLSRSPALLDAPRVSLTPLIQTEVARCQSLLAGKPVQCRLTASADVWVHARPELIGIIVGNLLRNACQHTDKGAVRVCIEASQLVIEDDGVGMPEAVQAHLFERYVRGDPGSSDGNGLGLSIVKRVVAHLGWQIHYAPRAQGGSCFILSFPAAATAPP